jgi:hypothetical protein
VSELHGPQGDGDEATDAVRSAVELTKKFIDNSLSLAAHTDALLKRHEHAVSLLEAVARHFANASAPDSRELLRLVTTFVQQDRAALRVLRSRMPDLKDADKAVASIHRNGNS